MYETANKEHQPRAVARQLRTGGGPVLHRLLELIVAPLPIHPYLPGTRQRREPLAPNSSRRRRRRSSCSPSRVAFNTWQRFRARSRAATSSGSSGSYSSPASIFWRILFVGAPRGSCGRRCAQLHRRPTPAGVWWPGPPRRHGAREARWRPQRPPEHRTPQSPPPAPVARAEGDPAPSSASGVRSG